MQELNKIKGLTYCLPATIKECTERIKWLNEINTRGSIATWIIIYQAKELIGENKAWQEWVTTNYPKCQNDSHMHQMYNSGKLLIEKIDQKIFKTLEKLDLHKLRALASMEKEAPGSIEKFLEKYNAVTMSRDELIEQVNIERGRSKGKSAKTAKAVFPDELIQPDLFVIMAQQKDDVFKKNLIEYKDKLTVEGIGVVFNRSIQTVVAFADRIDSEKRKGVAAALHEIANSLGE